MSKISPKILFKNLYSAVKFRYEFLNGEKKQEKLNYIWNELKSASDNLIDLKQRTEAKIKQLRKEGNEKRKVFTNFFAQVKHLIFYNN